MAKRELMEQEGSVFTLYKDYKIIGREIKEDLLKSQFVLQDNKNRFAFNMSESNKNEGLLGLTYGLFMVSTLIERFDIKTSFSISEINKIKGSYKKLIELVKTNGFDVSPFSKPETNKKFFAPLNGKLSNKYQLSFIESLTWTMSCLLYALRMNKKGTIDFTDLLEDIYDLIAKCLAILVDNVIHTDGTIGYKEKSEDYIGWGPLSGCTEISLYFTHSVCETFGDVEDTIIGNEVVDNKEADNKAIEEISKAYARYKNKISGKQVNIVELFKKICLNVSKNIYLKYKNSLGKKFFFADGSEVASVDQIAYSLQSPVLLNQIYVVLIIVYANYFKEIELKNKDEYEELGITLKNAVDMVYELYSSLQKKGKENIVNREYVTFSEMHPNKEVGQLLAGERINVAILEALIIKAKAMIVTYVSKYPEKEIEKILKILDDSRSSQNAWIWNNVEYDLQQTERSISAILEFYDYYESYQRKYAEKDDKNLESLKIEYERNIRKLEEDLAKFESDHKDETEKIKNQTEQKVQEAIEDTKKQYVLENVIRKIVEDEVRESFINVFVEILGTIEKNNGKANEKLSPEYQKVKDALINFVLSFFIPFTFPGRRHDDINDDWDDDDYTDAIKADLAEFVKEWIHQLYINNKTKYENDKIHKDVLNKLLDKMNNNE